MVDAATIASLLTLNKKGHSTKSTIVIKKPLDEQSIVKSEALDSSDSSFEKVK